MKHGPIALIDEHMPVVAVVSRGLTFEKMLSNMEEVKARQGKIISVSDDAEEALANRVDAHIPVPATTPFLAPILFTIPLQLLAYLFTIPLQLLAYHIAVFRGTDVDQPRNLAKSVTVE
jgi:glucosamine--fructose-6-phosphate aminotransferase (isomerizing)